MAKECWSKKVDGNNKEKKKGNGQGFQVECFYCYEKEHRAWDCLKKKNKQEEDDEENINACADGDEIAFVLSNDKPSSPYPKML